MRISRFLHNRKVTTQEMAQTAAARTARAAAGRHVLAIQDTTSIRVDERGAGIFAHPVLAVDAASGFPLGLVDVLMLSRAGGARATRRSRDIAGKQSRRWLEGAQSAARLRAAGAACVTVVEDREGDIYDSFALRPAGVEKLVRVAQNRRLAQGGRLFEATAGFAEAGRMSVDLPAAPGRAARTAHLALRFAAVSICKPRQGKRAAETPDSVAVQLVEACEIDPPAGAEAAHWRLLTTHRVADAADARRIVGFYRQRWTIEQLFRTAKSKGFALEALRQRADGPLEKLVVATLIAAATVMQLVAERDGALARPLEDGFDPHDRLILERLSRSLEGKTQRQKNPHPEGSLAFAAWVMARLGGWTGYYGKPGPIVMLRGLIQFQAIKHGAALQNV